MVERDQSFAWSFALQWVALVGVSTTLATAVGFMGLWSIGAALEPALGEAAALIVAGAFFGAALGLGAAVGSAGLLQRAGVDTGRWIGATVAAGAVGMGIAFPLLLDAASRLLPIVGIALALGLPIGVAQTALLRRRGLAGAWWAALTVVAFLIATAVAVPAGGEGREWVAIGAMGLLYAAITAVGGARVLRREPTVVAGA